MHKSIDFPPHNRKWRFLYLNENRSPSYLGTGTNAWITSAQAIYQLCIQLFLGSRSRCTKVRELDNIYITPYTSRSLLNQVNESMIELKKVLEFQWKLNIKFQIHEEKIMKDWTSANSKTFIAKIMSSLQFLKELFIGICTFFSKPTLMPNQIFQS